MLQKKASRIKKPVKQGEQAQKSAKKSAKPFF